LADLECVNGLSAAGQFAREVHARGYASILRLATLKPTLNDTGEHLDRTSLRTAAGPTCVRPGCYG